MRAQVDLIPEHVASRIIAIQERLNLSHVYTPIDRARMLREQTALWDEHFPGKAFEEIRAMVPAFVASSHEKAA